jgi:DNA-binding transcriptional MerR regulator
MDDDGGIMLRIGTFARIGRVSVKTLRHYDAIGLLKPDAVDESSGYRYYRPRQLRRLHRILDLKSMGFSLDVVRELVDEDLGDPTVRENLLARREELARTISLQQEQLRDVEARLKAIERGRARRRPEMPEVPEVLVTRTKPRRIASLRSRLSSYEEADALFDELDRRVELEERRGPLGAIWHGCEHEGAIDCEAFYSVDDGFRTPRGVSPRELPASTMVSVLHYGSDETHEQTYAAAREWIRAGERKISGPNHEIYLSRLSRSHGSLDEDITEIHFPLERW